ncbi:MAG: ATP-dependent DNA helicase RecG [Chitinophagaceae bacterium]|nr:ATP-dependent DNA helicase RecG [Chitinophagaceae bacterium]
MFFFVSFVPSLCSSCSPNQVWRRRTRRTQRVHKGHKGGTKDTKAGTKDSPYFCRNHHTISTNTDILSSPIEFLKGVGPQKGDLLKKELGIYTFGDLLEHYPLRHIDKTKVVAIKDLVPAMEFVQVKGKLLLVDMVGDKRSKRMVAQLRDETDYLELTWFQGITYIQKYLEIGKTYLVYGRLSFFQGKPQIVHPEMEVYTGEGDQVKSYLEPVYPSTEKLKVRNLGGRQIGKLTALVIQMLREEHFPENLPAQLVEKLKLIGRFRAHTQVHFPDNPASYNLAIQRIKFEELFMAQIRWGMIRAGRHRHSKGVVFEKVGDLFNGFYNDHLPFPLTNAQKRVIREIRTDTAKGHQMNRLLQGDVGSGKTIVALLIMLLAADNGYQSCLMAPTEILARQHLQNLQELVKELPVGIELLTGSTKKAERNRILASIADGTTHILIGTHAVIEEAVQFSNLGLAIIDEQHRFGVAQRARLWEKGDTPPHVLVMTATPIPRTLAMTAYGDLDYSVINEMPPGRQPIITHHRFEDARPAVMDFIKAEIAKGRQAYIIFPLIEESPKLDLENLMKGYENVKAYFPEPKYWISMVHGRQPAVQKQQNMHRFVTGDTQIMVSTTVIEVGVNVPNASVMVIESAERFGLSQLHQLRGRVGRGSEKSYCILITGKSIGRDTRERMEIMTSTNDGFVIAEKDLDLRGPGDIEGTRQSGELNFKLANIVQDRALLETARNLAMAILEKDPELNSAENLMIKRYLQSQKRKTAWSRIS